MCEDLFRTPDVPHAKEQAVELNITEEHNITDVSISHPFSKPREPETVSNESVEEESTEPQLGPKPPVFLIDPASNPSLASEQRPSLSLTPETSQQGDFFLNTTLPGPASRERRSVACRRCPFTTAPKPPKLQHALLSHVMDCVGVEAYECSHCAARFAHRNDAARHAPACANAPVRIPNRFQLSLCRE